MRFCIPERSQGLQHNPRRPLDQRQTRRQALAQTLGLALLAATPLRAVEATAVLNRIRPRQSRAAIIGHTGHGNYGHELEQIFNGREEISVVAIADPDPVGRAQAASRSGAQRQYDDYRAMLAKEQPDLVCVAPRCTDEHYAMAEAALRVGAHLYLEKPFTQTLAEADALLQLARDQRRKIAVAHQMRLAPNILALKQALDQGRIGELLEIRAHGKQDHRAGGEDLIVLGVHQFDLMRFFAGDPLWCAAKVTQAGHEITLTDVHPATESIGPVAGDEIHAQFAFPKGVHASFVSLARNQAAAGPWGMELLGSKGSVRIQLEMVPRIYTLSQGNWTSTGRKSEWQPWADDPALGWPESERGFAKANARVVDDWLQAIAEDREPRCSGFAGMRAVEMALAVFEAGLTKHRVTFPMANRQHPLKNGDRK